ncbi:hypothetical protein [Nostoc sp.]|uniref:hypothetical protein n=1 Tax=Nostoc sp. TaxID=1180 RepID=UPI002FF98263
MRQLRFVFIAFTTFLFVIGAVFLRRTVAVLLCGILSFNSASCYGFLNQIWVANAQTTPPPKKLDLTGTWIARNTAFALNKNGCSFATGENAVQPVEVTLIQRGNELILPNSHNTHHKGAVSGNQFRLINLINQPYGTFTIELVGNITNGGNTIIGETSCKGSAGSVTSKGNFTWVRKSLISQASTKTPTTNSSPISDKPEPSEAQKTPSTPARKVLQAVEDYPCENFSVNAPGQIPSDVPKTEDEKKQFALANPPNPSLITYNYLYRSGDVPDAARLARVYGVKPEDWNEHRTPGFMVNERKVYLRWFRNKYSVVDYEYKFVAQCYQKPEKQ